MATARRAAESYRFKDSLGRQPIPCPACGSNNFHKRGCPIETKKRRYFGIGFLLMFGPILLGLAVWRIASGDGVANVIGEFLDPAGLIGALIGCALAGYFVNRARSRG
jgi:hypothetical protein